jgi:hypothetical protein
MADEQRGIGLLERAKGERRPVGDLVGEDDVGVKLVDDRGELLGDSVRLPEQVVHPLLGLVSKRRDGAASRCGEEVGELARFLRRLILGSDQARVASRPESEQAVLESVGGDTGLEPCAGRDDDICPASPECLPDRGEGQAVRGVVGADEQGDQSATARR